MIDILSAIIPVAGIVLIGFYAGKTLDLDRPTLSRVVLYILSPVLIADSLYRTTMTAENMRGIFLGFTLTYLLLCLLAWGLAKKLGFSTGSQKSFIATTAFPNNGNMGLPVNLFAFGEPGLERAVVYLIASSIVIFSTAPAFLKGGSFWSGLRFTLKLPLIWAMLVGWGLRLFGPELPLKLNVSLHLVAQAAIPIALLLLGIQIANSRFELSPYEGGASLMRLIGGGLVAFLVGKGLGLTGLDLKVLILQSSMPAAINSFLMVNEFGGDSPRTARVVVISTLLAFVTLPIVLWAIAHL
jgi:predicted permease